jgi:quinol monooxygenase YgiN
MFGTVARMTVQPGKESAFLAVGEAWTRARGENTGQVAEYVFRVEGQELLFLVVGIFRDQETYRRNASDPETDRWYRKLRATLASDPEWNDGEIVQSMLLSGI